MTSMACMGVELRKTLLMKALTELEPGLCLRLATLRAVAAHMRDACISSGTSQIKCNARTVSFLRNTA